MKKALPHEDTGKRMAEDVWLHYFNRYLFEHGTVTEKEYKKMTEKIAVRKAKLSQERGTVHAHSQHGRRITDF